MFAFITLNIILLTSIVLFKWSPYSGLSIEDTPHSQSVR